MADCPHHGLKESSFNFPPPGADFPRAVQIAICRPIHCPECAIARVKKLRDALHEAIRAGSGLLYSPGADRADVEGRLHVEAKLRAASEVYYQDLKDWSGP